MSENNSFSPSPLPCVHLKFSFLSFFPSSRSRRKLYRVREVDRGQDRSIPSVNIQVCVCVWQCQSICVCVSVFGMCVYTSICPQLCVCMCVWCVCVCVLKYPPQPDFHVLSGPPKYEVPTPGFKERKKKSNLPGENLYLSISSEYPP